MNTAPTEILSSRSDALGVRLGLGLDKISCSTVAYQLKWVREDPLAMLYSTMITGFHSQISLASRRSVFFRFDFVNEHADKSSKR